MALNKKNPSTTCVNQSQKAALIAHGGGNQDLSKS